METLAREAARAVHTLTPSTPPTSNPPEADRVPRLAIVTSDVRTDAVLRAALEGRGYELVSIGTGDALVGEIQRVAPDLVILDTGVEDASPLELCGEIRSSHAGRFLPLVLVAMRPVSEAAVAEGLMAGADDFCSPRERPTEFTARIGVQLRQKRVRDRLKRVRNERDHFRRASRVDPLTGLLNRGSFDSVLGEAMAGESRFAILFIDIDHFKSINDRFGHETGDEALRGVARCIERSTRGDDRCGRYGGEEFVVLVAGADLDVASAVAERHRVNFERVVIPGLPATLTASLGVAIFDPARPDLSREALYRRADAALYRAKDEGRNRVVVAPATGERFRVVTVVEAPPASVARHPHRATAGVVPDDVEARLLRAMSHRAGLPLLPEAAAQALQLARDPMSDIPTIARLVDRDPTLAARFLALVNSPIYSYGGRIVSTQAALVRLGLATARDLLLQVVYERSRSGLKNYRAEVEASFDRSVLAAMATVEAARRMQFLFEDAYLCGLLHDLGEGRVYRALSELEAPSSAEVARSLVERHHAHAGAEVARAWGLPEAVVEACGTHHDAPGEVSPRVRIVMIADCIAGAALAARGTPGARLRFTDQQQAHLSSLGLEPKVALGVLEGLSAGRSGAR